MREYLLHALIITLMISSHTWGQNAMNITKLDQWHNESLITTSSKVRYSDCYGFVYNNQEYAVIGSTEGTHVFLISDQDKFIEKGFVRGRYSSAFVSHRQYATYQNYLYAVCDEGVSSLQIIDLSYLPDSITLAKEDTLQFGRVHNIFIDPLQQKFYSCTHRSTTNTQQISAPMKIFSLTDPLNLQELWSGPDDIVEVHDIYVRNGKAILNCGYDGLRVYDFSNTTNPAYLDSKSIYQEQGFNHQGWLTPDGKTYLFADETNGMRVKKCAFNGSIVTIQNHFGTNYQNGSVPHNIKATNDFAFVAYYNEGLRIFDLRYPVPLEVAYFDSYPDENNYKMFGNWGVYAELPSKRLLISDRQYGLFLLHFDQEAMLKNYPLGKEITLYPNPILENQKLFVTFPKNTVNATWEVFDLVGNKVFEGRVDSFNYLQTEISFPAGKYLIRFQLTSDSGNTETLLRKIIVI